MQKLSFMVHLEDTANSMINDRLMIMNKIGESGPGPLDIKS